MDKTVKFILSLSIAILYPLVVWFVVITAVPEPSGYSTAGSNSQNRLCQGADLSFQYGSNACEEVTRDEQDDTYRPLLALGIALFTIVILFYIRDIKELVGGLVVGASIVIIGAIGVLLSVSVDDETRVINSLFILAAFTVLTGVLYGVDHLSSASHKHTAEKHKPHEPKIDKT